MTIGELLATARNQLDDTVAPYRWSADELAEYLNNAVYELCECKLIKDSSTAAICSIDVVADTQSYALDKRIVSIERAKLSKVTDPLTQITVDIADNYFSGWDTQKDTPSAYINDEGKIILVWIPDENDTLTLTVYRLPLSPITVADSNSDPEVPLKWQHQLYKGIYKQAYDKHDSDTYDPKMRDRYNYEWEIVKDRIKREWIKAHTVSRRITPNAGAI